MTLPCTLILDSKMSTAGLVLLLSYSLNPPLKLLKSFSGPVLDAFLGGAYNELWFRWKVLPLRSNLKLRFYWTRKGAFWTCHAIPSHQKNMPNKNNKYTNQSNKYAMSIKRVRQLKHQVCHINQKNTPTKTPSTPSQSKEYANQNTKYAISIKRIRQPKHQVHHLNPKSTPTKTLNAI